MRKNKKLVFVVASLFLATLWGCGSNLESGGDQTGPGTVAPEKVGSNSCEVCHSAIVALGWTGSAHDYDTAGCEGCHGGGQFHKGVGPIPVKSPTLENQCVQCHTAPGILTRHKGDDPATATIANVGTIIEGYTFRAPEPEGCRDCHGNIHNPPKGANRQWANSGHGGFIATGPVTPATADAWGHYNWDDTATRGACQRCHTATGISNFLTNPAGYAANGSGNNFSHLSNWSATGGSPQQELLYCWGCHSDVSNGTLRNPGAITENYILPNNATTGTTGTTVQIVYPDISDSNVCMGCHLGREVGQNIKNIVDADGKLGFVNSHYLTAGATIFTASGYEYAGQIYDTLGFHKNVGVANTAGTGTHGPCVTCHMHSAEPHTFSVVKKDANGAITTVTSTSCGNCHGGMTPAVLEAKAEEFATALGALKTALEAKGIFFQTRNPYFFVGSGATAAAFTDWQSVATAIETANPTTPTPIDWRNVMGAAFNYNLFKHDPGAYAHNNGYALKLIQDSIDFLGDGLVNGSASIARTMVRAGFDAGTTDSSANPLHTAAIASVNAAPATGLTACATCHKAAAHFGGNATSTSSTPSQWVAPFIGAFKSCSTCHAGGNFSANAAILDQYATSNHGDVNGAWNHVNSTAPAITVIPVNGVNTNFQTWCGRCHTTKGFIDQAGAAASNTAIPLWPANNIAGQTMLDGVACDACHTDVATAATRVLGTFTTSYYSAATAFNVAVDKLYPDVGPSSICIRCHSGRDSSGIGQLIKDGTPAAAATVLRTHYLGSALTLFNAGGYHFGADPAVYTNLGTHKNIGAGGKGPCVTCHMSGTAGHVFWPIAEDEATGTITAVLSDQCSTCHAATMTAAYLTGVRNDFKTIKNALDATLAAKGIHYKNEADVGAGSTGRFFSDPAFTTASELTFSNVTPTVITYSTIAATYATPPAVKDLMGAAFNLGFVDYIQEPGAYAHNWDYARKLLTDSIDLVADGVIDGNGIPAAVAAINAKY